MDVISFFLVVVTVYLYIYIYVDYKYAGELLRLSEMIFSPEILTRAGGLPFAAAVYRAVASRFIGCRYEHIYD